MIKTGNSISSDFPIFRQLDAMDCGPACLKIICSFYGKEIDFKQIKKHSYLTKQGVSLAGIIASSERLGFETLPIRVDFNDLKEKITLPCIVHWKNNHFLVVYKVTEDAVYVSDPRKGLHIFDVISFKKGWLNKQNGEGVLLLIEPTNSFYSQKESTPKSKENVSFLINYFKPYKKLIVQLFLGLLVTAAIQLSFPFLTQSLVDKGINNQDINIVYLILFAQLIFFLSIASINIIRSWILLHITTRINIKLISDFLHKLLKLPIAYFQTKQRGDLLQRIYDHDRVKDFISSNTLSVLFGTIKILLFGGVLAYFNLTIFLIFFTGSTFYVIWTLFFMKKRAEIDYERFEEQSNNHSTLNQLLSSITEIKLNGSEQRRKQEWKTIQYRLFNVSLKGLGLSQKQMHGGLILNQMKNIFIIFFAAKSVIDGTITLGTMLAIQYIIGQLEGPISNGIAFFLTLQDANISIKRLSEVHNTIDEQILEGDFISKIDRGHSIKLDNVSFRYGPPGTKMVLENINLSIPEGKVTAIVGPSGSGKTTLLKLLLKFYDVTSGTIQINQSNIQNYEAGAWRRHCGVVMQDGYIFNDSLKNNITESNSTIPTKTEILNEAIRIANLNHLISELPNNIDTVVGSEGSILSGGERQRILIARAVYKEPKYLMFDEATSSLDSSNEKYIMSALSRFFKHKTVVVIAHRLSTVKEADQIVVLDKGTIKEIGNHQELINLKGKYFELVKNQL